MPSDATGPIPDACAVAFKEWEGVCSALERGEQSIILRKGGIEEGPGGFVPEYPAFWLYPTRVHQGQQGLKPGTQPAGGREPASPEGAVALGALAVVDGIGLVDRAETLPALDALHVWTEETVLKRFHYKRPGLWVLGVRVYTIADPFVLPVTPEHAGCKTWVPLGRPLPTRGASPVLDADDFQGRMDRLRAVLGEGCEPGRRR
jgi:hypothetical protein